MTNDHEVAANLASEAGELLVAIRSRGGSEGDRLSNELLLRRLAELRPDDAVLSEESVDDPVRLERRRVWIVDPLDGTREYGGTAPRRLGRSRSARRRRPSARGRGGAAGSRPGLLDLQPARGGAPGCWTDPSGRVQDAATCVRRRPAWPTRCRLGPDGLRRCQGNGRRQGARRCLRAFGRSVRVGFVCTCRRRECGRITRLETGRIASALQRAQSVPARPARFPPRDRWSCPRGLEGSLAPRVWHDRFRP